MAFAVATNVTEGLQMLLPNETGTNCTKYEQRFPQVDHNLGSHIGQNHHIFPMISTTSEVT